VASGFWSPIVETRVLPPETWARAAPMPGLELELDRQLEWLKQLAPAMAELDAPLAPPEPGTAVDGFHLANPMFGPMDAYVLYAVVRDLRPRRVLELGSGYSTLVIERALGANAASGSARSAHEVVDPHPSELLGRATRSLTVRAESAAATPEEMFTSLAAGDLLFVDTSHVVVPGGEVVRLVLELLPALAPGVTVHFHDIYRPFEYPRALYDVFGLHWQEQYLLQAFLAFNPGFEVLCANQALWRLRRERIESLLPSQQLVAEPSSLWFVRR
jgi:hypothetical protein